MPVVYALIGSLVVALLFIPLATKHLMTGTIPTEPRMIGRANRLYQRALGWVMGHRIGERADHVHRFRDNRHPHRPQLHGRQRRIDSPACSSDSTCTDHYTLAQTDSIMRAYEEFMLDNRERFGTTEVEAQFWRDRGMVWSNMRADDREWVRSRVG